MWRKPAKSNHVRRMLYTVPDCTSYGPYTLHITFYIFFRKKCKQSHYFIMCVIHKWGWPYIFCTPFLHFFFIFIKNEEKM